MSNTEFENYLALIGKLLQLTRQQQESIGTELRDHLESRVADLIDGGLNHSQAIKQALEEFGDAALMAKNLQFVSQLNRRRWIMRFAAFSIVGCFLAAVLTMALWPDNARFGAPDRSVARVQDQGEDDNTVAVANGEGLPSANNGDSFGEPKSAPPQISYASTEPRISVFQINQQIEKALLEVVDLNYDGVEWNEVRRDLFDRFKFNIINDPLALDAGLVNEEPISVSLSGLQLETCLKHLLKSKECTFIVKDGALVVIPIENAGDPLFVSIRAFDCRQLISRLDLNRSSKRFEAQSHSGLPAGGSGMGPCGMFCILQSSNNSLQPSTGDQPTLGQAVQGQAVQGQAVQGQAVQDQAVQDQAGQSQSAAIATPAKFVSTREELLTNLVTSMVGDANNWSQVSSSNGVGNLKVVNGYLVARHTRDVLKDVEVFLNMLEMTLQEDAASPVK